MITRERLMEVLDYNKETGVFRWKVNKSNLAMKGCVAGSKHRNNRGKEYIRIRIDGKPYTAHRIAYLYVHGYIPIEVDHRDNNGLHNWICNLRDCTRQQNNCNKEIRSDNTSGYKGVSKFQGKWKAKICCMGIEHYKLGFENPELAYQWYCEKSKELHGEFSRV